uniref:AMP-dependent synthetase/ligase domain-containing protein n=1 Tax=Romanomermis culicivorax TaxID=13658 RepID=A0A915JDK3_ROMCU
MEQGIHRCTTTHKATSYNRETYHPRSGAPYIHVYPFFHSGGLIFSTLWPLCEGSHLILLDEYDSGLFLEAVEKYKPELFIGPPPVLVHMTKSEEARSKNLSSLKAIISGAMPVSHELKNAIIMTSSLLQGYGLTEASPMTHMMPLAAICNQKLGSCGVLIVGTKAKIVDVDSQIALPPDCLGELCIFGPQVMSQYLNNVQATSQTIDHDGWLHTAPADLEHILIMHDSIKDVAIIGVPNDEYGQVPMAFVVPKEGTVIQSDTVRDHIQVVWQAERYFGIGVILFDK